MLEGFPGAPNMNCHKEAHAFLWVVLRYLFKKEQLPMLVRLILGTKQSLLLKNFHCLIF